MSVDTMADALTKRRQSTARRCLCRHPAPHPCPYRLFQLPPHQGRIGGDCGPGLKAMPGSKFNNQVACFGYNSSQEGFKTTRRPMRIGL